MSRTDQLRDALEAIETPRKKLPTGFMLRGSIDPALRNHFKQSIRHSRSVGFESMQIETKAREDAIMSLYVIKPKQTGFTAVAELTAAALKNPTTTAMLAMSGESGDAEAELDMGKLTELVRESGANVFIDPDDAINYINSAPTEDNDLTWVDPTEGSTEF